MSYGELIFGNERFSRNPLNGQFMKGHVPANKGKKWKDFMPKRSQRRSAVGWKNLDLYRKRSPNSGRPPKMVVAITDNGEWKIFSNTLSAAIYCGGNRHNVSRCCRENLVSLSNTNHRYMGFRFYFENDTKWLLKINNNG